MKVALIAYGYCGKLLCKYLDTSEEFELVSIVVRQQNFSVPRMTGLNAVLSNSEIEAVFICTPIESHYEICKACLLHQKHVFCEKPTVKKMDELLALLDLAKRMGKILYTDYIYTLSPSIHKIPELLYEIGEIKNITGEICQFGRFYPQDTVAEVLGVHLFSILVYLFPEEPISKLNKFYSLSLESWHQQLFFQMEQMKVALTYSLVSPEKTRWLRINGTGGCILFNMMDPKATLKYITFERVSTSECRKLKEAQWMHDETNNIKSAIKDFYKTIMEDNNFDNIRISKAVTAFIEILS